MTPDSRRHHAYQIKVSLAIVAVALCALHSATAYPTGSMSCSDIGDFAAATVVGKQNGRTLKEALATVNDFTADYPIERKNTTQIVRAIYTWAKGLSEDGARAAFTADCEAQKDGQPVVVSKIQPTMKIRRHGRYRNRGEADILDQAITEKTLGKWSSSWNDETCSLTFSLDGQEKGRAHYTYHIMISGPEICALLSATLFRAKSKS